MCPLVTQQGSPQIEYGAAQVPPPTGIASRLTDLVKAVQEIETQAYQVKAALGIISPKENEMNKNSSPSSLADVLTDLRIRLTRAGNELQDAVAHLNS